MNPISAYVHFVIGFWLYVFDRRRFEAIEITLSRQAQILQFPDRKGK